MGSESARNLVHHGRVLGGQGGAADGRLSDHLTRTAMSQGERPPMALTLHLDPAGADEHEAPRRLALGGDGVAAREPLHRAQVEQGPPALASQRGQRRPSHDLLFALRFSRHDGRGCAGNALLHVHEHAPLRAALDGATVLTFVPEQGE